MPGRIYVINSTGGNVKVSTGDRVWWRDLAARYVDLASPLRARGFRYTEFSAVLSGRLARIIELAADFNAYAQSGYDVWARDLSTNAETLLGFVADGGALTLIGVALADGEYEVELRLRGYYWQHLRSAARFRLKLAGGAVAVNLPAVTGLGYRYNLTDTQLSWAWAAQAGTDTPDDFAIWTGPADPVNTAGAPAYVIPATSTGPYASNIVQGAANLYAAICTRGGVAKGPMATLLIPAPPPAVNSPDGQLADFR